MFYFHVWRNLQYWELLCFPGCNRRHNRCLTLGTGIFTPMQLCNRRKQIRWALSSGSGRVSGTIFQRYQKQARRKEVDWSFYGIYKEWAIQISSKTRQQVVEAEKPSSQLPVATFLFILNIKSVDKKRVITPHTGTIKILLKPEEKAKYKFSLLQLIKRNAKKLPL